MVDRSRRTRRAKRDDSYGEEDYDDEVKQSRHRSRRPKKNEPSKNPTDVIIFSDGFGHKNDSTVFSRKPPRGCRVEEITVEEFKMINSTADITGIDYEGGPLPKSIDNNALMSPSNPNFDFDKFIGAEMNGPNPQ